MDNKGRLKYKGMGYTILRSVYSHTAKGWKINYSTKAGGWAIWPNYQQHTYETDATCKAAITWLEMNNPEKYIQD